jgi:hypothetical protein
MPTVTAQIKAERDEVLRRSDTDPLLTYNNMAADAGVSLATLKRAILPFLPVVEVTEHRRGVRRSDWERHKRSRTRAPRAAGNAK